MKHSLIKILESWGNTEGNVHSFDEIMQWINKLNETTHVRVDECSINDSNYWFYDDYNGEVLNIKRSFFSITGMRLFRDNRFVCEQPVIIQPEIGYLGIICKEINGVLNFLMQGKIEPGNVNCVQISPTIQATKSNFTRAHGGRLPAYFSYFENASAYRIIYDQIQSEQASRFYKKRNRNIIICVDEDIEVHSNYMWMTLGQIKKLMETDNLVNMDARTVLSGVFLQTAQLGEGEIKQIEGLFSDKSLFKSMFFCDPCDYLPQLYYPVNNYKMFRDIRIARVPLNQLIDWSVDEFGITCLKEADFMVRYYDIEISGREVHKWIQPLFKAVSTATFGLITKKTAAGTEFLVKAKPEIGSFDRIEIGPCIQWESTHTAEQDDPVERVFREQLKPAKQTEKSMVTTDVILSEEGGRFYHEQNRNVIIEVSKETLSDLPQDYFWTSYSTLNHLIHVNNCLNIQLRNLLSLIKI